MAAGFQFEQCTLKTKLDHFHTQNILFEALMSAWYTQSKWYFANPRQYNLNRKPLSYIALHHCPSLSQIPNDHIHPQISQRKQIPAFKMSKPHFQATATVTLMSWRHFYKHYQKAILRIHQHEPPYKTLTVMQQQTSPGKYLKEGILEWKSMLICTDAGRISIFSTVTAGGWGLNLLQL